MLVSGARRREDSCTNALVTHDTTRYANNRAEVSHQPTRQRERQMRGFTSSAHAQCFLHVHGIIHNRFAWVGTG